MLQQQSSTALMMLQQHNLTIAANPRVAERARTGEWPRSRLRGDMVTEDWASASAQEREAPAGLEQQADTLQEGMCSKEFDFGVH